MDDGPIMNDGILEGIMSDLSRMRQTRQPEYTPEETKYLGIKNSKEEPWTIKKWGKKTWGFLKDTILWRSTTGKIFQNEVDKQKKPNDRILINFLNQNLEDTLESQQNNSDLPQQICVYQNDSTLKRKIIRFVFGDEDLASFINMNFQSQGILHDSPDIELIEKYFEKSDVPCQVALRMDKFDKYEVCCLIKLADIPDQDPQTIKALLKETVQTFRTQRDNDKKFKRDIEQKKKERTITMQRNIQIINNLHNRNLAPPISIPSQIPPPDQPNLQASNLSQSQGEINTNALNPITNNISTTPNQRSAREMQIESERLIKEEQDRSYREMVKKSEEEHQEKLKKEEEEKRKLEEQERKKQENENRLQKIKETMPEEPPKDERSVNIVFRLPNGSRKPRRFLKTEKIQLIHDFVETMEDIGFEEQNVGFDILCGYPPAAISIDEQEKTLDEKFPGSKQELLLIKEKEE